MDFEVTNRIGIPMYEQIKEHIISAIIEDRIKEGEQLDSIRILAKNLRVSVITVMKAYNELEEEGYIVAQTAKGYYVADRNNELFRERLISSISICFEQAVVLARRLELSNNKLIQILRNELGDDINE